jgi:hypothetical protein
VPTFDAGNPAGGATLDGVGAGLVHGLAGGDVGGDFFVGQSEEADRGDFSGDLRGRRSDNGNAGNDAVGAAGEQAQHARGVVRSSTG